TGRAGASSRSSQDNPSNLERRTQPHRRPPVTAAARHVELRAAMLVAPGEQAALLDLDDVVPRPDLAAVGVARQLEIDAVVSSAPDLAWLVREQHERAARIAVRRRARQILAVAGPALGAVVVDAGEVERRTRLPDRDQLVAQKARPEPRDLGD